MGSEAIESVVANFVNSVDETRDDFIFSTIIDFMGHQEELSKIIISKQILCRALVCFREEHADEYYKLLDESNERCK